MIHLVEFEDFVIFDEFEVFDDDLLDFDFVDDE